MDEKEFKDKFMQALLKKMGWTDRRSSLSHQLFDPDNKKTMSRLSLPQIKGMQLSYTFEDIYGLDIFRQLYDDLSDGMISHKGLGREELIEHEKAQKPLEGGPQIGIFQTKKAEEKKEERKKTFWGRFKKGEVES